MFFSPVNGAAELKQTVSVSRPARKTALIDCIYSSGCYEYIHWYQKKEGEPFKRVMYMKLTDGSQKSDPGYGDFKSEKSGSNFMLKIPDLQSHHAATYHCACWDYHINGAADLQQKMTVTRSTGKTALIECVYTSNCRFYIHWYQKTENEAFKRIQYIDISDGTPKNDPGHDDLKAEKRGSNMVLLKIPDLKTQHSATYYCACWITGGTSGGGYYYIKIFGSGTKLVVTGDSPKPPKVTLYSPSEPKDRKITLLCNARDMMPDIVRFEWSIGDKAAQGEVLEQVDPGKGVTSMLIIDEKKAGDSKYSCKVKHEIEVPPAERGFSEDEPVKPTQKSSQKPSATCPTKQGGLQKFEMLEVTPGLRLFVWTYTSMIVKSVVYFIAVCVLLYQRRAEAKLAPTT
ncbi:immunoglobulin lambda-1 light chain-like [Chanos chanos]|uniref:immunoglobulin lambda-1 light chain-like n=1 Tax=Chanos chanos TaxID=29144 RepID=UPI0011F31678|nr:immunoglobulin lambda-1 light chain-like [Chanos chanos]